MTGESPAGSRALEPVSPASSAFASSLHLAQSSHCSLPFATPAAQSSHCSLPFALLVSLASSAQLIAPTGGSRALEPVSPASSAFASSAAGGAQLRNLGRLKGVMENARRSRGDFDVPPNSSLRPLPSCLNSIIQPIRYFHSD